MATQIRAFSPEILPLATAVNSMKTQLLTQLRLAQADVAALNTHDTLTGTFVAIGSHNDQSEKTVGAATASDLPTSLTLCADLLDCYQFHMADTLSHKVLGVAAASYVHPLVLADAITAANDLKSKYNTHRASTTYHYTADSTNVCTAANATDLASLETLLNDLSTQFTAHFASGYAGPSIRVVGP